MLRLAALTQRSIPKLAQATGKPQLVTIPVSHYVDVARLSLELAGIEFDELAYAPGQHVLPTLNLRLCGDEKHMAPRVAGAEGGNPTAVPALVMPDRTVHRDSWAILEMALGANRGAVASGGRDGGGHPLGPNLADETDLDRVFYDAQLGPDTRQLGYATMLAVPSADLWDRICADARFGRLWGFLWRYCGVRGQLTARMRRMFHSEDTAAAAACRERVAAHFDVLDAKVRARKGRYLHGDRVSQEDVALCALGAPAVMPPEYAGGWFAEEFALAIARDPVAAEFLEILRRTDAGKYIMEFYREARGGVPSAEGRVAAAL